VDIIKPYIKEVLSGNGRHGWREVAAVERYLRDRQNPKLFFDEELVNRRLKAAKLMRHTKDRFYKIPFTLQPFQIFCIVNIFGFYWVDNGKRRFRRFYFDIARKNGKTEFAVLIGLLLFIFDDVAGAEGYFAATKRDQAAIGFDTCKTMLTLLRQDSKLVAGRTKVSANSITAPKTFGVMRAVSSDAKTLDGLNPLFAIIDEYHAHPTSKVLKVMETGMGARENPLIIITTTAGFNRFGPCKKYRDVCDRILKQTAEDDNIFAMIFSMDEEDDWKDENNWYKCNPNLEVSVSLDYLRAQFVSAVNEGESAIVELKTKNLNSWESTAISFISDEVWMRSKEEPTNSDEMKCWGALDLSTVRDLTVYLLLFEDGSIIPHFFCPAANIEDRDNSDGVDYGQWFADGFIHKIQGNAIDQRVIKEKILEMNSYYNVQANIYDPWRAEQLAQELIEKEVSMIPMSQTYKNFTEPIQEIEKNALNMAYKHGAHPILRWNMENAQLKVNSNGNMMFDKSEAKTEGAKIDGVVALAMAEFGRKHKIEDNSYKGAGPIKL